MQSVKKVSHHSKQVKVISYLLANHVSERNPGVALRNVLEAYGVAGVKFAQIFSTSDILPKDVRKELAKAKDQARRPSRVEIYDRLSTVTGVKNVDQLFTVGKLLGSASVKYTILVTDGKGKKHALQIKREEAEASISKDLRQLDFIVDALCKKNSKKYSFLRGVSATVKDAIWRELSLPRESIKADVIYKEMTKINFRDSVKLVFPHTSTLLDGLPINPQARFYLRSSEFSPGKTIEKLELKKQREMARAILEVESQLLFPSDKRKTHFDPDRHSGNILLTDNRERPVGFSPIDWGQLLSMEESDRIRVARLLAYSEVFERTGVPRGLLDKLIQDFSFTDIDNRSISKGEIKKMAKELRSYYPNRGRIPRSSMVSYYYLLSVLEKYGLERNIVNYDLIKGIFQLEAYMEMLPQEKRLGRSTSLKRWSGLKWKGLLPWPKNLLAARGPFGKILLIP